MTDKAKSFFREEGLKQIARLSTLAVIAIVIWILTPIKDRIKSVWLSPETLQTMIEENRQARDDILHEIGKVNSEILGIKDELSDLRRPTSVFEISLSNSGPRAGHCVELEPCDFRIKIRRIRGMESCRVIPETDTWKFLNPFTDVIAVARRIDSTRVRNFTSGWEIFDVRISTPSGLSPRSDFFFERKYSRCPGLTEDSEPVISQSKPISIDILRDRMLEGDGTSP